MTVPSQRETAAAPDPLADYYARRAAEYERIYAKPERQADLARLHRRVPECLAGRDVLEIACGTGYWTCRVAPRARSVLATDVNDSVLEIARAKPGIDGRVELGRMDLYDAPALGRVFDGALAAFWWSHVPRAELDRFLDAFHAPLAPGARVVMLDNRFVDGSSTPIARRDAGGDAWQVRALDDGSTHEVLKNFPTDAELRALLEPRAARLEVEWLDHYWLAVYALPVGRVVA
jgi:demethylmenaquinone methyltransferase/2-methoxy-6-polyprenyl-1,4-benzoquinol methylase